MNELEVRKILDKYWDGETSLEEEHALSEYFARHDVADDLAQFAPLFTFFTQERSISMPSEIKAPIPQVKQTTVVRKISWWRAVAAAVVLALGIFFIRQQMMPEDVIDYAYNDTFEDPEEAYAEFKKAMAFVSNKMNKGMDTAAKGINKVETLTEILN